jgi:N-acetylneuraminic acid mutarotase
MVTKAAQYLTLIAAAMMIIGFLGMPSVNIAAGDTWTKKADMPGSSFVSAAAAVDGKIYVFGGSLVGGITLGIFYEYDPANDEWKTKADIPTPRCRHSACAVNGKIYVIGGTPNNYGDDNLATVEEYDPATDTWTRKADMPTPRHSLATNVVDGKIYAIAGHKGSLAFDRAIPVPNVEVYDPATDTWEKREDMPYVPHYLVSTGVVDGKIYFARGSATYEYDPVTDTWKLDRARMPTTRIFARGAVANDRFYVISGYHGDFDITNRESVGLVVEAYDPFTDTWATRAPMVEREAEFGIAVSDGKIYTFGGLSVDMVVSTVEEYTPEGWPFPEDVVSSVTPKNKMATLWGDIKSIR